jgi:hypothetical protein
MTAEIDPPIASASTHDPTAESRRLETRQDRGEAPPCPGPAPTPPIPTVPIPALPIHTLPIPALPIHTLPIPALPIHTLPIPAVLISAVPIPTLPIHTLPIPAVSISTLLTRSGAGSAHRGDKSPLASISAHSGSILAIWCFQEARTLQDRVSGAVFAGSGARREGGRREGGRREGARCEGGKPLSGHSAGPGLDLGDDGVSAGLNCVFQPGPSVHLATFLVSARTRGEPPR